VIEGLLGPLGFVVTPAMDGDEALRIIKTREYLPDVVLLDVQMPGKTGYQVAKMAHELIQPIVFIRLVATGRFVRSSARIIRTDFRSS
jgi:CheY-like chemotaxis protein